LTESQDASYAACGGADHVEAADIQKMYGLRCNSYITKPVDFDNFVKPLGSGV
jgi:hypothetical protein